MGEDEVILLGHKISCKGIEVDPSKVQVLIKLPSPKSVKEVASFIQKVKYMSSFIYLSSQLLHPLQKLTQQVEFFWIEELEEYFCSIKQVLSSLPVLMPPCFEQSFFVNPSIGAKTMGAALLQQDPLSSRMKPIYFTSRVLLPREKAYTKAEQIMSALIFAVRKFWPYLLHKPFVVLTVEHLFPWVSTQMSLSSKISKRTRELQEYKDTFKVEDSARA